MRSGVAPLPGRLAPVLHPHERHADEVHEEGDDREDAGVPEELEHRGVGPVQVIDYRKVEAPLSGRQSGSTFVRLYHRDQAVTNGVFQYRARTFCG